MARTTWSSAMPLRSHSKIRRSLMWLIGLSLGSGPMASRKNVR